MGGHSVTKPAPLGRPPIHGETMVGISVKLLPRQVAWLAMQKGMNASESIRRLIDEAIARDYPNAKVR